MFNRFSCLMVFGFYVYGVQLGFAAVGSSVSGEAFVHASGQQNTNQSIEEKTPWTKHLAWTNTTTLYSPAISNLDASEVSARTGLQTQGYSLRHQMAVGYRFDDQSSIGPVLDIAQPYYGLRSYEVIYNDPQIRWSFSDLSGYQNGPWSLRMPSFFSFYIPLSKWSQDLHESGALSATFIPILHHSDFPIFVSSVLSLKTGGFMTQADTMVYAIQFFGGLQANYESSRYTTPFIMVFSAGNRGRDIPMTDEGFTSASSHTGIGQIYGGMAGIKIKPTSMISITPRYAVVLGQPLSRGSLALNAYLKLF